MAGRLPIVLLLAGLLYWGPASGPDVLAQELLFEQVGDLPIGAHDLDFDTEGGLWGSSSASDFWYLDPDTKVWEGPGNRGGNYFVALTLDTLLISNSSAVHRSVDSGQKWILVHSEGMALVEFELDGPNNGLVLTGEGNGTGIAYSTDRGGSFTSSTFTVSTSRESTLHSAVEIPDGPAAGRLVAGVFNGIVVSEDGGQTWAPSSLFEETRFVGNDVEMGTEPLTGNRRLFASVTDAQAAGGQLYVSDDNGMTWVFMSTLPWKFFIVTVPAPPNGDGFLLALTAADGVVYRSNDGGSTLEETGEVGYPFVGHIAEDILLGPDGKMYVAVSRTGPEPAWVYRSTEPVVVATEPAPQLPEPAEALRFYPNPASDRVTVEGAAAGEAVLFDLLGRAVLRQPLVGGRAVLDVSRLPAGVYVVRVGVESRLITIHR